MDTSKHVFQLHGVNAAEVPVLRKKLRRKEMVAFFQKLAPTVIAIEACGASHHLARLLQSFGHTVKLIAPQLVKPYVKRGKNDAADAEALCEAMSRPTMRFVPVKTTEQQAALMLVGVRDRLIRNRTQVANTIRGYAAEFGLTTAKGMAHLVPLFERIGADESLPALARELFAIQAKEYTQLQAQIDEVDAKLAAWHRADECSRRLAKIPGVGPIGAVLLTMKTPDPAQFQSGRQFAAWIGLTPKDHSTAGKVRLGVITRAGDEGLRSVLVVGATAVIQQAVRSGKASPWLAELLKRKIAEVGGRSAGQQDRAHRVEDDADRGRLRRESRGRRLGRRGLETRHPWSASTAFRYVTLLRASPCGRCNIQPSRNGNETLPIEVDGARGDPNSESAPAAPAGSVQRSARHGEHLNCNRAEPMPELAR